MSRPGGGRAIGPAMRLGRDNHPLRDGGLQFPGPRSAPDPSPPTRMSLPPLDTGRSGSRTVFAVLLAALPLMAQAPFGDPRPRLPGGLGEGLLGAAIDVDRDRDVDLIRVEDGRVRVLLQAADGTFAESDRQPVLDLGAFGAPRALVPLDVDGDGAPELVVGTAVGPDLLLRNDGTGVFAPTTPFPATTMASTAQIAVADFDRDGVPDVLGTSTVGPARLYFGMPGGGGFVDTSALLPAATQVPREAVAVLDVEGDGDVDVVLGATRTAPGLLLLNDGRGSFLQGATRLPGSLAPVSQLLVGRLGGGPDPDLLAVSPASNLVEVLVNNGAGSFVAQSTGPLTPSPALDVHLADLDQDRFDDLLLLAASGAVLFAPNTGTGQFGPSQSLLDADDRSALVVTDLEPDGDPDLWALGFTGEDRLLLGRPTSLRFVDSEDRSFPLGSLGQRTRCVAVDVTGEGDPDLVHLQRDGSMALAVNDGGGRFREGANGLPRVPGTAFVDLAVGRIVNVAAPRPARDLFALGVPDPLNSHGLRVLRWSNRSYVDATANVLPPLAGLVPTSLRVTHLDPLAADRAPSDVLVGAADGSVTWLRSNGSAFTVVPGAVQTAARGAALGVVVGDWNGDGFDDLAVLHSGSAPELHLSSLASGTMAFRPLPQAAVGVPPASDGVSVDLDGDGLDDLVLVTPSSASGLTFLQSRGAQTMVDVTPVWLAQVGAIFGPRSVTMVDLGRTGRSLAVGCEAGEVRCLVLGNARAFDLGSTPLHGTAAVETLDAADLDLDGDDDLVCGREQRRPAVLLGRSLHLGQLGMGQGGRPLGLDVVGPPGTSGFLLMSPFTTRQLLPGVGLVRLLSPATIAGVLMPASGRARLDIPVPTALGTLELPLQMAFLDFAANSVQLGNLVVGEITDA